MKKEKFALDSARSVDENGFLRVKLSHITKATVNPYRGCEIPNYKELGLKPDAIYYALRDPKELQKSLDTWKGLPLHLEHHIDDAVNQAKDTRVGNVGTDPTWNSPYIDATLTVWDNDAINKIKDGTCKEISCAYRYEPDFTSGYFNGEPYDFVMRNIRGNHVALVEEGRAGHDVVVADSKQGLNLNQSFITTGVKQMAKLNLKRFFTGAQDSVENEEMEIGQSVEKLGKALQDLHKTNEKGEVVDINLDADTIEELKEKYNISDDDLKALIKLFAQKQAQDDDDEVKAEDEEVKAQDADISVSVKDEGEEDNKVIDKMTVDNDIQAQDEDENVLKALKLAGLENATDEVKQAFIKGLQAQNMANDEEEQEEVVTKEDLKVAEDRAIQRMEKHFNAKIKAKINAVNKVAPLVGRLDPMAFDSASDVYNYALNKAGIKTDTAHQNAYGAMIDAVLQAKGKQSSPRFATDSANRVMSFEKNLKNIRIEE